MRKIKDETYVRKVYNHLHKMPEISLQEFNTSSFFANEMKKFGFSVIGKTGGTGVIGILDSGNPGPVLALRGDMDAIEFQLDGEKVSIHACGHDANSSMVLACAHDISKKGIEKGRKPLLS